VNVYPFIEAEKQEAGSVLRACRLLEVSTRLRQLIGE